MNMGGGGVKLEGGILSPKTMGDKASAMAAARSLEGKARRITVGGAASMPPSAGAGPGKRASMVWR